MDRSTAYGIVVENVKSPNLVNHMLAVEAAMRFYARKLGEDEETWGIPDYYMISIGKFTPRLNSIH